MAANPSWSAKQRRWLDEHPISVQPPLATASSLVATPGPQTFPADPSRPQWERSGADRQRLYGRTAAQVEPRTISLVGNSIRSPGRAAPDLSSRMNSTDRAAISRIG